MGSHHLIRLIGQEESQYRYRTGAVFFFFIIQTIALSAQSHRFCRAFRAAAYATLESTGGLKVDSDTPATQEKVELQILQTINSAEKSGLLPVHAWARSEIHSSLITSQGVVIWVMLPMCRFFKIFQNPPGALGPRSWSQIPPFWLICCNRPAK